VFAPTSSCFNYGDPVGSPNGYQLWDRFVHCAGNSIADSRASVRMTAALSLGYNSVIGRQRAECDGSAELERW